MSARSPRRSFLNPFVVTLAAAPACFVQSSTPPSQPVTQSNPGQPTQVDPRPSPPPPETQTPTIVANPPRPSRPDPNGQPPQPVEPMQPLPTANPPAPELPGSDTAWMITKTSRGCQAQVMTHCPPKAMCNPPPPRTYACVDGVKYPAKVTLDGQTCHVETDPPACPPNAMCNPPAPRVVPCPK